MIRKSCLRFGILTLLVMLTAFFMTGTVMSQSETKVRIEEKYYDEMERTYRKEVKDTLTAYGITDSGINMTHVSEMGKARTYTVIIHNKALRRMTAAERESLYDDIRAIAFPLDDCVFYHEFIADKEPANGL